MAFSMGVEGICAVSVLVCCGVPVIELCPLLQAWAVFKGKFKEGDKAEPATWKTRLRCALNKSPDFEEVTDRSQLDISEPYKVYRIVPEEEQKCNYGDQGRGGPQSPPWAQADLARPDAGGGGRDGMGHLLPSVQARDTYSP